MARGFQVVLNDTYTPTPTWVIKMCYAAYGHWHEEQTSIGFGKADPTPSDCLTLSLQSQCCLLLMQTPIRPWVAHSRGLLNRYVRD